jgi:hypothetical protein
MTPAKNIGFCLLVICMMILGLTVVRGADEPTEIVLWNTHNGTYRDRGSKECTVEVFRGGTSLWKKEEISVNWSPDKDERTVIVLPAQVQMFDRVRITITKWIGGGGGLAEIEINRGGNNLASKANVTARLLQSPPNQNDFRPERVTDGITTSTNYPSGYWLLPKKSPGWIQLNLP